MFESQYPDLKRLTIQVSLFFLLPGATVSKISVAEPLNCRVSVQISAISVAGPTNCRVSVQISAISVAGPTNCRVSVQISAISVDLGRPIGAFRPSWHLAGFPILPFGAKRGSAAPGSLDQGFPELRIEGASKPASAGRPSRVFDDRQGGKYGKAERPRGVAGGVPLNYGKQTLSPVRGWVKLRVAA